MPSAYAGETSLINEGILLSPSCWEYARTPLHFNKMDKTTNLPWVEKYRPAHLDDLISHKDIISTISRFVKEERLPHLLFYGPPGTGKTSTILAIAKQIYTPKELSSMVLEVRTQNIEFSVSNIVRIVCLFMFL